MKDLLTRLRECSHCGGTGQDPVYPKPEPCLWCKLRREAADEIDRLGLEMADARNLLLNAETMLDAKGGMARRINHFLDRRHDSEPLRPSDPMGEW